MRVNVGDRVTMDAKKVGQPRRSGVVAKVSQGLSGTRYEIRWDDDTVSVIAPSAGMLFVEPKGRSATRTGQPSKKKARSG